jgi:hypothetical protein
MASSFRKIWEEAAPSVSDHWEDCEEGGLPHTADSLKDLNKIFDSYIADLETVAHGDDVKILEIMKTLYSKLDALNKQYDMGLLETDERELLVPIIVDLAVAAGIDADKYDGEPGGQFRDF